MNEQQKTTGQTPETEAALCGGRTARAYWLGALTTVAVTGASWGLQGLNYWIAGGGAAACLLLVVCGFVAFGKRGSSEASVAARAPTNHVIASALVQAAPTQRAAEVVAVVQSMVQPQGPSATERAATAEVAQLRETLASVDAVIGETTSVLHALASGDFGVRVRGNYNAKFEPLKAGVNGAADYFADLSGRIASAADAISVGAGEIASGNHDLSGRTEQQASSLQQTASTMEEFTATVKNNADNARQADQLAGDASKIATKGGETVRRVVDTMNQISESSKRIQDIISVIDGIAFQTNILALNAAVEAARAGEQGRGFAVVAAEVRNLAQRSAAAAKEIKTLITESVDKVSDGTRFVDAAGKQIEEVVTAVKRVSDIISEITAASVEQSSGIEQVSQAVSQMDQMTQQNAALVEESAASAQTMREQATQLVQLVSSLRGGRAVQAARVARPAARVESKPAASAVRPAAQGSTPRAAAVAPQRRATPASAATAIPPANAAPTRANKVANGRNEPVDSWEEF